MTQKSGICIGSCVAALLADIYLAAVDSSIHAALDRDVFVKIVRYMDDYLVFYKTTSPQGEQLVLDDALKVFHAEAEQLVFTSEVPMEGQLQFLDLRLSVQEEHICWSYSPRSTKGLLPFGSCHSKLVKRVLFHLVCGQRLLSRVPILSQSA